MKYSIQYPLLVILAACTLLFTGCGIPSIHPLYEPEDLIQLDQLSGVWEKNSETRYHVYSYFDIRSSMDEKDLRETEELKNEDRATYDLYTKLYFIQKLESDEDSTSINDPDYMAGLLELGGHYFLDFYKMTTGDAFSTPVHIFLKVEIEDDRLTMYEFDEKFLRSLIENRQIRIKHEVTFDDNFVLTAQPSELKKFVLKYADESDAYRGDKDVYTKVQ